MEEIQNIVENIEKQKLYRGLGGEIIRQAVSHLIYGFSIAQLPFDQKGLLVLFKCLQENLRHPNVEITMEATKALGAMCKTYFTT